MLQRQSALAVLASLALTYGPTTLTMSASAADAPTPATVSGVLTGFLRKHSAYRVLSLDDVGAFRDAFESKTFEFRPVVVADSNGDGEPDIVAVLVKTRPAKLYSVVCFHGTTRGFNSKPIWLVEDSTTPILSVDVAARTITPITCYECDANAVFQWTGRDYDFLARGDTILLLPGAKVFASPDPASKIVFRAAPGDGHEPYTATAEVLDYGPHFAKRIGPYKRWYMVRVMLPGDSRTGYIGTEFSKLLGQ
jgi:hypothetical protein